MPPGTVVAFMGVDGKIPEGWVKCDGADITNKGASYNALKAVIGNSLPDLRGHFLKGEGKATGIPEAGIVPGVVGEYQGQDILSHDHAVDITPEKKEGAHAHFITRLPSDGQWGANISMQTTVESNGSDEKWANAPGHQDKKSTSYDGEHTHRINGNTKGNGGAETRPWTAIVNYIIKL
ncbi:MAG: phage tail protein [Polaribacter sp.]|nr:phage tail protein [Polaribacter sp.]MDG1811862.1 phage tail protein [Polaribacter sp.]MDG1993012.1 phage tail protein [Polaribacter sp.]